MNRAFPHEADRSDPPHHELPHVIQVQTTDPWRFARHSGGPAAGEAPHALLARGHVARILQASAMSQTLDDPLAAGRDAVLRHEWNRAFELLKQADQASGIPPEDLEIMAEAAWWAGRPDEGIDALERAYAAYLESGNRPRAGYVALSLAREYGGKLASSQAGGWFNRAVRLLESEPEGREHGYLYVRLSARAASGGNLDEAIEHARRALDVGGKVGDPDLQAYGLLYQGMWLVEKGQVAEGMALIDEATVAAVSGELGPYATGIVYCNTIETCREIADYRRAGDWTDAARRWCERQAISGFPGVCRVHQAEILALRGAWLEAEEAARRAAHELMEFNRLASAGEGFYQIGEIRLRIGDLAGAEDAFRQANEFRRDPQPGLSLLLLARGNVEGAAASIGRAVKEESSKRLARARLLPTQVEIALEAGDVDAARAAADELESIAADYDAPALHAAAHSARGAVLLAAGESQGAVATLRRGVAHWQDVEAPYEAARARATLARAIKAQGDDEAARLEMEAARSAFERLGASPDVNRIDDLLAREARVRTGDRARGQKTFLFTDIVKSTNLLEAIGDESWLDLMRWHDQTLRSLFADHHGEEVDHTGDGFFVAFDGPEAAITCAVVIQRTLAEHRRSHGFSPKVRIGLHATEATRSGRSYRGKGVHEAARIAALAEGGEIIASLGSVQNSPGPFNVSEARAVTLKGIAEAVQVVTIDWH